MDQSILKTPNLGIEFLEPVHNKCMRQSQNCSVQFVTFVLNGQRTLQFG